MTSESPPEKKEGPPEVQSDPSPCPILTEAYAEITYSNFFAGSYPQLFGEVHVDSTAILRYGLPSGCGVQSRVFENIPTAADAITSRDTEWYSSIAGGGTVTTGGGGAEQPGGMRNVVQPDDPEAAAVAPMEQAVDGEEQIVAKPELEKSSSGEAVEDEVMEEVELVDAVPPASTILGG